LQREEHVRLYDDDHVQKTSNQRADQTESRQSPRSSSEALASKRRRSESGSEGESERDSSVGVGAGARSYHLWLLQRVFPHEEHENLAACLDKCQGDVMLAIDRLLPASHAASRPLPPLGHANHPAALASSFLANMAPRHPSALHPSLSGAVTAAAPTPTSQPPALPHSSFPLPPYLPGLGVSSSGFKSAFSPLSAQPPSAHLNMLRGYMYHAASAGRGVLPLYPSIMPSLSSRGYGYS
jgi:hypothetical protein